MARWLPPLSGGDLTVVLVTLAIIFTASRIGPAADWIERHLPRRP